MAKIGIMDSGLGGLSVFREIRKALPDESYIYYADNANCPYGDKTPEFIRERLCTITEDFLQQGVAVMVLACNTATAAAIEYLRAHYSIPFIGMEPAVKPAALGTKTGVIGVLATAGTLKGSKYLNTRDRFADQAQIIERVGKGFVLGTMFGCIFLNTLFNGFSMLGVDPFVQDVLKGVVLVLAIVLDVVSNRRKS